ncbi:MAG: LptE family protein [Phycisphaerales bacterium]|nr:LptE family protein [Phycisphaerales bacterium]
MTRLLLITITLILSCCASDPTVGYSSSSLYSKQFQSVAIPIFENNTLNRNLEFMLTDALIKEIQTRTSYRVVGEQYADTLLTGTIKSVDLQTLSQSSNTGLDNEVLIKTVIDFEWLNMNSGGRIVGRNNFSSSSLFIPSRPSSEPIEMGQFAVVQQLASDIVDQMQASW